MIFEEAFNELQGNSAKEQRTNTAQTVNEKLENQKKVIRNCFLKSVILKRISIDPGLEQQEETICKPKEVMESWDTLSKWMEIIFANTVDMDIFDSI